MRPYYLQQSNFWMHSPTTINTWMVAHLKLLDHLLLNYQVLKISKCLNFLLLFCLFVKALYLFVYIHSILFNSLLRELVTKSVNS